MVKLITILSFGLMAVVNLVAASHATGMVVACRVLSALLWSLFLLMTVRRSKSRGRERTPPAVATALASTAVTFPIGVAALTTDQGRLIVAHILVLSGLVFSVFAISHLGRCFGVLADARGLVTKGAYRVVRHPLYLGELTSILGLALAAQHMVVPLLFWGTLAAIQLTRIHYEERVLTATFADYPHYAADVPHRLVPGLY
jgi:protein-S-isoprenylcysteine O-methyltransferase Ste14